MSALTARDKLREARHADILPRDCSIIANEVSNTLHLNCDAGAILRPVIRLDRVKPLNDYIAKATYLTWEDIWSLHVIELIDQEEATNTAQLRLTLTMFARSYTRRNSSKCNTARRCCLAHSVS